MSKSAVNQLITKVNNQSIVSSDVLGLVVDWFDVRVMGTPVISSLERDGYCEEYDNGCATHYHYFETDKYSIAWDIKSSYIKDTYSHVRLKNECFYGYVGNIREFAIQTCCKYFNVTSSKIFVSRIDLAIDMLYTSLYSELLHKMFLNKSLDNKITKYALFRGKVNGREYVNFTAGNRGSRFFYRFYNKSIENFDFKKNAVKKEYINDWHYLIFGDKKNADVMRFELEFKPQLLSLTDLCINDLFRSVLVRFFGLTETSNCFFGERYQPRDYYFTEKEFLGLLKQLRKLYENRSRSQVQLLGVKVFNNCMVLDDFVINYNDKTEEKEYVEVC